MCCRLIRVTCRWGILPINWDASLCVSSVLGGGCIYVYNCFLIVYIVCIFAGLVMVGSGGLGRTISNQVGCWQPNLGLAFSSKALVYESARTDPRIN